jgi:vanillate O-demethylase ferredoxin subunit
VDVDHSCKEGYCGTCLTRWTDGAPIHRDTCMSGKEREKYVALCTARAARGATIVLDI